MVIFSCSIAGKPLCSGQMVDLGSLTVRSSARAAVGIVTELVNMHASLVIYLAILHLLKIRVVCSTSAEGSCPLMSYVIVVGELSEACSKVTVPVTLESPRTTATIENYLVFPTNVKEAMST